jgi:hypothetical protein
VVLLLPLAVCVSILVSRSYVKVSKRCWRKKSVMMLLTFWSLST